jgi:hypothetical protein
MIQKSYFQMSDDRCASYTNIQNFELDAAIDRYMNKTLGGSPADEFLRKIKAVTSAILICRY